MSRSCSSMKKDHVASPIGTRAINEADTNADTCCLGANFTVLHYTNRTADLIINEALFYGNKLDHSLANPNQVRFNGVRFWDNPYDNMHELGIEVYDKDITIPMYFNGTKLIFESTVPTERELNVLPHLILTSSQP